MQRCGEEVRAAEWFKCAVVPRGQLGGPDAQPQRRVVAPGRLGLVTIAESLISAFSKRHKYWKGPGNLPLFMDDRTPCSENGLPVP